MSSVSAIFSTKLNNDPNNYKYFLILWLANCLPIWPLVSKYSKDIVVDYSTIVFLLSAITLILLIILNKNLLKKVKGVIREKDLPTIKYA